MNTTTQELLKGFKNAPAPENTRAIPGAVFNFLAMGSNTNSRHALIRISVYRGAEPPAHTHSREDESYYVLEGSVCYHVGQEEITVNAGDYIYLPKDVPHAFKILSDKAELLMWISPAGLETWFWDNSVPAPDGKPLPMPQGPPPAELIQHFVSSLQTYGVELI